MRNTLAPEIEQLEADKAELEIKLSQSRNEQERRSLMDEINATSNKINLLNRQQEQEEAREKAIEEKVHSEIAFAIPGVDFTQLPVELINIIHAVVKADRRRIYAEHAVELEQVENERDEWGLKHKALVYEYGQLQEDYNTCARELKEQTEETVRLIAERDDARANRDNAAAQLAEANAEIERLKGEIDDYQKAKVYGEREAQSIIDVTENEADDINNAIKKFLTSEDWGSSIKVNKPDGTFELVKRAEFNAEWQPLTVPTVGGSETPAETFQNEDSESDVSNSGVHNPEVPSIAPSEEETTRYGLDENETVRSDDAPATYGELKALAARVSQLEQKKVNAA